MTNSTQYQINCQICFCIAFSSSNSDSEDLYSSSNNQFQNSLKTLEQSNKKDNESFDSSDQQDQEKSIVDCFTDIDHTQQSDERMTKMNEDLQIQLSSGLYNLKQEFEQKMQEGFQKQLEQISMLLKQNNKQDGQSNQTNQVQN